MGLFKVYDPSAHRSKFELHRNSPRNSQVRMVKDYSDVWNDPACSNLRGDRLLHVVPYFRAGSYMEFELGRCLVERNGSLKVALQGDTWKFSMHVWYAISKWHIVIHFKHGCDTLSNLNLHDQM